MGICSLQSSLQMGICHFLAAGKVVGAQGPPCCAKAPQARLGALSLPQTQQFSSIFLATAGSAQLKTGLKNLSSYAPSGHRCARTRSQGALTVAFRHVAEAVQHLHTRHHRAASAKATEGEQ